MQTSRLKRIMHVEIKNLANLKQSFIPFLKNGGLFIDKDSDDYCLGDKIEMQLQLLDNLDAFELTTQVIWLPAKEITDPFTKGIGVEFCEPHHEILRNKIELLLQANNVNLKNK